MRSSQKVELRISSYDWNAKDPSSKALVRRRRPLSGSFSMSFPMPRCPRRSMTRSRSASKRSALGSEPGRLLNDDTQQASESISARVIMSSSEKRICMR